MLRVLSVKLPQEDSFELGVAMDEKREFAIKRCDEFGHHAAQGFRQPALDGEHCRQSGDEFVFGGVLAVAISEICHAESGDQRPAHYFRCAKSVIPHGMITKQTPN